MWNFAIVGRRGTFRTILHVDVALENERHQPAAAAAANRLVDSFGLSRASCNKLHIFALIFYYPKLGNAKERASEQTNEQQRMLWLEL